MEVSLKQRIIDIMDHYNFTNANQLASKIGVRATKIYNVLNGKTEDSYTLIQELANSLHEFNREWIEHGRPPMLIEEKQESSKGALETLQVATIPMDSYVQMVNDLREVNKDLQERLKNEISYEKEIKELRLKIQALEFKLGQK